MRRLGIPICLVLCAAIAAAVVSANDHPEDRSISTAVSGNFSFASSREGEPIFTAAEIAPGDSLGGTVEIANTGTEAGALMLSQHDLLDVPGPGGGALSGRLTMRIRSTTAPGGPALVYEGPLAPMPAQPLGSLAPGESQTFEFVATLPEGGTGSPVAENAVQGASTTVAYRWTVEDAAQAPRPVPPAGRQTNGSATARPPLASPLRLRILRISHTLRHGRLLVRARCDRPCRIRPRGRFSAPGHARWGAKLRSPRKSRFPARPQRLVLTVPSRLLKRLRPAAGKGTSLRIKVVLLALDGVGERAVARRALRVRRAPR